MKPQIVRFRSATFYTDIDERQGGRSAVVHEYPFSEAAPYTEDTGLTPRRFRLEGYVIGAKYDVDRDALLSALEEVGPGELVHPKFGTKRVMVVGYREREERARQRIAYFSIEFAETTASVTQPATKPDANAALSASVASAEVATQSQFETAYAAYNGFRDRIADNLRRATKAIDGVLNRVTVEVQANASLRRKIGILRNDAVALVSTPARILSSFVGVFEELQTSVAVLAETDPSAALLAIYNYDPGTRPTGSTPSRVAERVRFDAVYALVQRYSLIAATKAAINQTFTSYDDAVSRRDQITALLDANLESANDSAYPALFELRAALVTAVPGADSDLPRLQTLTLNTPVPSLVLAHRLYGKVELEADIVARNNIVNPGFVPAAVPLEVLSRG